MTRSIHDNLLVSYEVQCEARTITLRTECRVPGKPTEFINVILDGVEGYSFQNDAFGNIILSLDAVPLEYLLKEFGAEIRESYRVGGSPGPWAANLESASEYLRDRGVKGFILSSSYGLSGWILAKEMSVLNAEQDVPAGQTRAGIR